MKIIIAGGRNFNNYKLLVDVCDFMTSKLKVIEIVCGTARGADTLGERYAKEKGYPIHYFKPDWELHGKSAGYKRNSEMAEFSNALIAFWDGKSRGTKHMIDLSKKKGLKIKVVLY